ncbi:hypothetical protein [Paenibacillus sp. NPDC057967]|uniref:hypothetical protein n=1 Tax=Paenibacillus sp. NPDC057967 TaxID=3346293 RepID=UPI0036DCC99D
MWAEVAAFFKANTTEALLISIIGTILVWMYRQFKGMIDREQQDKLTIAQLKQTLFTKLELSIASVLHLNNEDSKRQMYVLLGECGPYLTKTHRTIIRDYYKQFDRSLLYSLHALVMTEVDKLTRQLEKLNENKDNSEWLHYIQRLYAPIWPIILLAIMIMFIFMVFSLVQMGSTLWLKMNLVLLGVTIFIAATIAVSIVSFMVKRELGKQGAIRWSAIALIIFSPVLIFVINRIDASIYVFFAQVLGLAYISYSKRPREVIMP